MAQDRPKSQGMTTVLSLKFSNSKMYSRFFEIQPTWNDGGQIIGFTYTQLRNNQTYINYYTLWFRLITTAIIPFILMLICNLGIIVYYRKNRYVENLCSNNSKYTVFSWVKKIEMGMYTNLHYTILRALNLHHFLRTLHWSKLT